MEMTKGQIMHSNFEAIKEGKQKSEKVLYNKAICRVMGHGLMGRYIEVKNWTGEEICGINGCKQKLLLLKTNIELW